MQAGETRVFSRRYTVGPEHVARHIEADGIRVLSTPSMVGFIEETCRVFWDHVLPEGYTTVGVRVDVHHIRPAVLGSELEVRATALHADEKRVLFWVEVWSGRLLIGYALHERAIVEKAAFAARVKSLIASSAGG
ncbi:MAG: thioesterase [Thermofilum sp.]|nr:thioesterase [Thermofilum sp.]